GDGCMAVWIGRDGRLAAVRSADGVSELLASERVVVGVRERCGEGLWGAGHGKGAGRRESQARPRDRLMNGDLFGGIGAACRRLSVIGGGGQGGHELVGARAGWSERWRGGGAAAQRCGQRTGIERRVTRRISC